MSVHLLIVILYNNYLELNNLMLSKRSNSRSKIVLKLTPKLRSSIKPERPSLRIHSNDPTEDASGQPIQGRSSKSKPTISLTNSRDRRNSNNPFDTVFNSNKVCTMKTWDTQGSEAELIQLLEERDTIISKMTREKYQLETELNSLRRRATKSLLTKIDNTKTLPTTYRKNTEMLLTQRNTSKNNLIPIYTKDKNRLQIPHTLISTKLASGLNLITNLEKCIMGVQCDMRLMEIKDKKKGVFSEELEELKEKIKRLVKIADEERILTHAVNV